MAYNSHKMRFAELKKHLSTQKYLPAYMATGEDSFLLELTKGQFKRLVTELPEFNVSIFEMAVEAHNLVSALQTLPLAYSHRLVICHEVIGDITPLAGYLTNPNPTTIFVFVSIKLPENLSKLVSKFEIIDCAKLDEVHIMQWVNSKLKETESTIEPDALRKLLTYCNNSLTRINLEAQKLGAYKNSGVITADDVEYLVEPNTEYQMYELSDAVGKKQAGRVADILTKLYGANMTAITLLGMLYSHFRRLLFCVIDPNSLDLAKNLGVKDYAVKMAKQGASVFTPKRLKAICDAFHKLDLDIKTGKIGDKLGLDIFILQILLG